MILMLSPEQRSREQIEEIVRRRWMQPDDAQRAALRALSWTGHNIPITESESTLGPGPELIGDNRRTVVIKSLIRQAFPDQTISVLDLGSLEGGLSLEMAREGWLATGVEGREANFQKAEAVAAYYGLPNLRFTLKDIKDLRPEVDGTFDVILCCGVLYHLDRPVDHLRLLESMLSPRGLLFLDTHIAPDAERRGQGMHAAGLSEPVTVEVGSHIYEGAWWSEPQEGDLRERMWSATSNERSLWLTRRSLIRALYHSGFHAVQELFGMFDIDAEFDLRDQYSRLYLACRKDW
jgi:SAM-dependent methyltransferase